MKEMIDGCENFHGYIPDKSFGFIIHNYQTLAAMGALEEPWLDAYVHKSHFQEQGVTVIKSVFDACDLYRLRKLKPLGEALNLSNSNQLTLFRGCAGLVHSLGMSWTPSLDKAIWYAAHHMEYHELGNPGVYVATVPIDQIYCRLDHYDDDFIVHPTEAWRIDVPGNEFRLNRQR